MDENVSYPLRRRSNSRTSSPDVRKFLASLPIHIVYDLKYVRIFSLKLKKCEFQKKYVQCSDSGS